MQVARPRMQIVTDKKITLELTAYNNVRIFLYAIQFKMYRGNLFSQVLNTALPYAKINRSPDIIARGSPMINISV